jgi:hypothetical protein
MSGGKSISIAGISTSPPPTISISGPGKSSGTASPSPGSGIEISGSSKGISISPPLPGGGLQSRLEKSLLVGCFCHSILVLPSLLKINLVSSIVTVYSTPSFNSKSLVPGELTSNLSTTQQLL